MNKLAASCLGMVLYITTAMAMGGDPESDGARASIIELYEPVHGVYFEAHAVNENRIDAYASLRSGVCSRRTHIHEVLVESYHIDPDDAEKDWDQIACDMVFFDGEDSSIGLWGLDGYVVHEFGNYPKPWGGNPVHTCVWPMIAIWAADGELTKADSGGWVLKVADRNLWIAFDDRMRVEWVEHKYVLDRSGFTRWSFGGYEDGADATMFPSDMNWSVQVFNQTDELDFEVDVDYLLHFDMARAQEEAFFFLPDGSVRLKSRNEIRLRRISRETNRPYFEIVQDHEGSCGPLDLGWTRYDPKTGDVFNTNDEVLYNLNDLMQDTECLPDT